MAKLTAGCVMACLVALSVMASAQEKPSPAAASAGSTTPVKLQVVMTRFDGEKKVSSMPYTVLFNATEPTAKVQPKSLMMGVQVPLMVQVREAPTVAFKDVGAKISGSVASAAGGRYHVLLEIEQSHIAAESARQGVTAGPVLRTFRDSVDVMLRDGQTTQTSSATDPVTGEVLKIDITLAVVK